MPYQLQGNCVMKKNSDGSLSTVKCHPSREKALNHLRALYVNVEDAKGGPGSGNFGHEGRPGMVGGSSSDGGGSTLYDLKPGDKVTVYLPDRSEPAFIAMIDEVDGSNLTVHHSRTGKPYKVTEKDVRKVRARYLKVKGGAGSGNFGHAGRPGLVGGSSDSGGRVMNFIRGLSTPFESLPIAARSGTSQNTAGARKRDRATQSEFDRAFNAAWYSANSDAPQIVELNEVRASLDQSEKASKLAKDNTEEAEKLGTSEAHAAAAEAHQSAAEVNLSTINELKDTFAGSELGQAGLKNAKKRKVILNLQELARQHKIMALYHRERARSPVKPSRSSIFND